VRAFEEAYKLAQRPPILFSMAQAYRRQYALDRQPDDLRKAVRHYRDYIEKTPTGGRRADAATALEELEPKLAKLDGAGAAEAAAPVVEAKVQRIMLSSPTPGAIAILDGGKPLPTPLSEEVPAGKHKLKLSADGYFDEEREIQVAPGDSFALDLPLRERPAQLTVKADSGSQVSVDGRPMGQTPMRTPIDVTSGRHLVAITKVGHAPVTRDVTLRRGENQTLDVALGTTGQRRASYVLLASGAAAVVAGGVFTGLTLGAQQTAQDIGARVPQGITTEDLATYDKAVKDRDRWRAAAALTFGAGVAIGATGFLLYVFDSPSIEIAPSRSEERSEPTPPKPASPGDTMEMSATPLWGPGFAGGSIQGRF
jgi:hypothetical protein